MRKLTLYFLLLIPFLAACEKDDDPKPAVTVSDSLSMGAKYENDIYYSFANGIVKSVNRTNWDIAFYTDKWSSSILINAGAGEKLFTYPLGDTSAWGTSLDVAAIADWKPLFGSDTSWIYSAFEANQLGHPDYGWCVYNSLTHDLIGDSLYILQLPNQSFKKIWIDRKVSTANTYYFKVADLDGANLHEVTLNCNDYASKNFVYYNVSSNEILDREPAKTGWDILFTKYATESIWRNLIKPGGSIPTGVLLNRDVTAIKVSDEDVSLDAFNKDDFSFSYTTIGYDWKTFSNSSFTYSMVPDRKYFVKTTGGAVYKLVFKSFAGSSTGNISFEKKKVK